MHARHRKRVSLSEACAVAPSLCGISVISVRVYPSPSFVFCGKSLARCVREQGPSLSGSFFITLRPSFWQAAGPRAWECSSSSAILQNPLVSGRARSDSPPRLFG